MRAILYLRLSVSREESTSIDRQRADLRATAEREGWEIVREFVDEGLSGGKVRANATEALRMLRRGEADVLAVWKFDRWSRQGLGAVADLVEVLDSRKAQPALFVALQDGLRSDQSAWRIIATVLAEVARQERENTSARTKSSIARLKREGRWSGGVAPFGYVAIDNPDGPGRVLRPEPAESAILTEAAERIASGASLFQTTAWIETTSLRPRKATEWSLQALRQAVTGPAVVGRVTLGGDVLRDANGLPLQVYPPAIPVDTWHRARAALEQRARPTASVRVSRRSRLLSGIAICADCGGPLYVRQASKRSAEDERGPATYACNMRANRPGSGAKGLSIMAEPLEEFVVGRFLQAFGQLPLTQPVEVDAAAPELVEAEAALVEVTSRLAPIDLDDETEEELLTQRRALRARVRALREEASREEPSFEYVDSGQTISEWWESLGDDVDAKREQLARVYAAVAVAPGLPGRRGFDAARVSIFGNDVDEDYDR